MNDTASGMAAAAGALEAACTLITSADEIEAIGRAAGMVDVGSRGQGLGVRGGTRGVQTLSVALPSATKLMP